MTNLTLKVKVTSHYNFVSLAKKCHSEHSLGGSVGERVNVSCPVGTRLQNGKTRDQAECSNNGVWSTNLTTCQSRLILHKFMFGNFYTK